jgi:hypothetical protein
MSRCECCGEGNEIRTRTIEAWQCDCCEHWNNEPISLREWLDWVGENGNQSLDVLLAWAYSFVPSDVTVARPRPIKLGEDK